MAGDIGWKSVELQIEALIPGVLILAEAHALSISWFDYRVSTLAYVPTNEFARAALFVAVGYSLGVVSSFVSRLLVDSISERGPRRIVFGCFAHHTLAKAIEQCEHGKAWSSRTTTSGQDVAEAVAFLSSEAGRFITGCVVPFDFRG